MFLSQVYSSQLRHSLEIYRPMLLFLAVLSLALRGCDCFPVQGILRPPSCSRSSSGESSGLSLRHYISRDLTFQYSWSRENAGLIRCKWMFHHLPRRRLGIVLRQAKLSPSESTKRSTQKPPKGKGSGGNGFGAKSSSSSTSSSSHHSKLRSVSGPSHRAAGVGSKILREAANTYDVIRSRRPENEYCRDVYIRSP